jgi:D-xylose transport system substrate-binding protein
MKTFIKVLFLIFPCIVQVQAQKIGLLLDDYIIERWYSDQKYFTEKVKELGGEVLVEVAYSDTAQQVELAKKLIGLGAKVLVVIPTDSHQAAKIADLAKKSGVAVVSYDRLILSENIAAYVSYDNRKVGILQAKYALEKVPSGKFILMNGPPSDNNAVLFKAGQEEVLAPSIKSGKVKVIGSFVMDDWGQLGSYMKLQEFFSKTKDRPDAVIVANDELATGVITALPKEIMGKTIVTGQDADVAGIKNILAGNQAMTVYKPIKPLAEKAAEIAMHLARGTAIKGLTKTNLGTISVNAILLDPVTVDKSNYMETVIKDGQVKLSDLKTN